MSICYSVDEICIGQRETRYSRSFSAIILVSKDIAKIWTILYSFQDFAQFSTDC